MIAFLRNWASSSRKSAASSEQADKQAGPAPDCAIWHDITRALGQSAREADDKGGRK